MFDASSGSLISLVQALMLIEVSGADPGEVKWVNFHPPFSEPLFNNAEHRPQTPQPGFGSITLLQKFTPHFKILYPHLGLWFNLMITTEFSTSHFSLLTIVHIRAGNVFQTAELPAASHTLPSTDVHFHFR